MSAITPGMQAHGNLPPMASRFVNVDALPWQKSRYEGIETKTLLVDKSSGLLTMLMKMALFFIKVKSAELNMPSVSGVSGFGYTRRLWS